MDLGGGIPGQALETLQFTSIARAFGDSGDNAQMKFNLKGIW